ncbi:conserved hypothetical protein [Desulfotalea psychrophila LSv54]|uniref:tRNA-dihydrouridine synthase n=2 Tax=Desulfotalea psychrophila TaxID=84980 RepID=Q6AKJ6_DESPS|nr:conserved hypothetical protein [Desulfotalea psychrophila LSv54]
MIWDCLPLGFKVVRVLFKPFQNEICMKLTFLQRDGEGRLAAPPLSLAPMVGLSHSALRSLIADLGGCGLFYTEMLAARRLPHENPAVSSYLHTTPCERPLIYQLFIADVKYVAPALDKIHRLGGDGVDINLGCPAPSVRRGGAGAALAEDWDRVRDIVSSARRHTDLTLSAKIRVGHVGKEAHLLDFCKMLEAEGVDLLAVHARYHGEKFCRKPRWQLLAPICEQLDIPIFANGGIFSVDDARRCLELSGAAGLMLGRGAVERPWLFNEIAREVYGLDLPVAESRPVEIYFRFVQKMVEIFAPERQLGRIKEFTHYIAKNHQFGHHLASAVQKSHTVEEAVQAAEDFYGISRDI